jgi:arsenite methyltransferase
MLVRANENKIKVGAGNVEFVESRITNIGIESAVSDCIISNCVVNLVPEGDKSQVFKEMFRLLKSGGRVAISDILATQPLPDKIREDIALYCGCIAGASQVQDYESYLRQAGFNG